MSTTGVQILSMPFSPIEIKTAMFFMGDSISPGPNGNSIGFLKKHWENIGMSVIQSIHNFFTIGFFTY